MEDSPCTTKRERDSEEEMDIRNALTKVDDRRSGSLEVSTSKQNPSSLPDEQPRQSTPPSAPQASSTDNEEKCKVEVDEPGNQENIDIEMDEDDDEDDVTIVPPITATPNPVMEPDTEQDIQLTDESRNFKEEQEEQSDLEIQRQRQRQARRGPTPSSSPQIRTKKMLSVVSKTGVKRDREEYEEGQVDEDEDDNDDNVGIDEPGVIFEEKPNGSPTHGSKSTETQVIHADADNSDEIVIVEQELKDDTPRRPKDKKISTDGKQVTPKTEIKKIATMSTGKGPNPKASGKRSHYREFISPPIALTSLRSFVTTPQQSTTSLPPPPSPQPRLPKKLGINHMDLLYKTEREVMVCRICL